MEEAYVSFLTPPSGAYADTEKYYNLATAMIDSVHQFSSRPVLLFLIGGVTSRWNSTQYPQLIVANLDIMDNRLNFYFSKIRVALLSRVKVALITEADTLVYGSDELFATVKAYATKHPLMPVHPHGQEHTEFLYFNGSVVTNRSMPYMHAHLAWSYWNLPFLAEIYTQCIAGPNRSVLSSCANDEVALNVALWAIGARHQLCLFDPYFSALSLLERQGNLTSSCMPGCMPGYKNPVAFSYIHGNKDPATAQELVRRMKQAEQKPKFYAAKTWYQTRADLQSHEQFGCLL